MLTGKRKNKGFTLIEVILSLVIAGMLSAVAAIGIIKATEGFLFTRQSIATAQKGQLVMTRLTKEFNVMADITSSSATEITFNSYKLGAKEEDHQVSWDGPGTDLRLDNDPLTDLVDDFALAWYQSYSDTDSQPSWDNNQKILQITLSLKGAEEIPATFTKMVRPRNLGK